jgi:uncharacterized protein
MNAQKVMRHLGQNSSWDVGSKFVLVRSFVLNNTTDVHVAFQKGNLEELKIALGHPPDFPNCHSPNGVGENCLEYAIYHSPLTFICTLLELGADPNYSDHSGFPSLIAALSTERKDKFNIIELLISYGADIRQRGVNDYTPLHYAANNDDPKAIELLLSHGADPNARTNIDDFATPLEEAENLGRTNAAQILRLVPLYCNHIGGTRGCT